MINGAQAANRAAVLLIGPSNAQIERADIGIVGGH